MQVDLYKMVLVIVLVAYHNKIYFTYCVINIRSPECTSIELQYIFDTESILII